MIAGGPVAGRAARALLSVGPQWRIAICRQGSPLTNPLETLGFEIALNPDPARGLSSSLALGIERAAKAGADAALVALADMPFVTGRHLFSLLGGFALDGATIVPSTRGTSPMPPPLFHRTYFAELVARRGD